MPNRIPISVVVPSRDRPQLLDDCLSALKQAIDANDELIVVDSASSDARVKEVALAHKAIYIRCDQPGTSRARNAGWRAARFDLIAFIDDDVRVYKGWANALAATFDRFPNLGFATGFVGIVEGEPSPEYGTALKLEEHPVWLRKPGPLVPGHGANLALRRVALERVGGFDESLGGGARFRAAEDRDLIDRLMAWPMLGRYEPTMSSWHAVWRRGASRVRLEWSYGVGSGARLAKLRRADRATYRKNVFDNLAIWVFRDLYNRTRERRFILALAALARLAGISIGFVTAHSVTVDDGHFRRKDGVDH